ncbi:MAG: NlpC/P60 family protein [Oscillospiraceae bacterium]|nr:NlpC/P60 family protein [Oscillospiraceae bacterium]
MKDIKTRPKTVGIKARDAASIAPKELSGVLRETAKAKILRERPVRGEDGDAASAAANEATAEVESRTQGIAARAARRTYQGGKKLAQKTYDQQFRSGKTADAAGAKGADRADGQPLSVETPMEHAKQKFRQNQARQTQEKVREIKVRSEIAESRQVRTDWEQIPERPQRIPKSASKKQQGNFPSARQLFRRTAPPKQATAGEAIRAEKSVLQRAKAHTTRKLQAQAVAETQQKTQQAAKIAAKGFQRIGKIIAEAAKAVARAAVGLLGGAGALVALLLVVVAAAAVVGTPFGIFFTAERNAPGTVSAAEAIGQVKEDYNAYLEQLQSGGYDSVVVHGQAPDWEEVLAVFAAKTAGTDSGTDVATLDTARVTLLKETFWDMTVITTRVEIIDHDDWTETILHIYITPHSVDEMRTAYAFTNYQNTALDELLNNRAMLTTLAGSLSITNTDVLGILDKLPEGLQPQRDEVVKAALSLAGNVNYFWGGKSLVLGWDSRWGQVKKVWADGSPTTGTYRPYGLDCSGFVDWVFYNATAGAYIIGHGGGAAMQHTHCASITANQAQPGDLAFYTDDSHVGVIVGRNDSGKLLVCHCSSGSNNVVVSEFSASGFTGIGRPIRYVN